MRFFVRLIVTAVLSLLNAFVNPLLVILTIPITIMTLGLFLLVINALIILATSKLVNGFQVDGFWYALLFSIVLTIVVSLLNSLVKEDNRGRGEA